MKIFSKMHEILFQPLKVFWICFLFLIFSLLFNGSLLRIYSLNRDHLRLVQQIAEVKAQANLLNQKLKFAQEPEFIERQAVDRYDLAQENDLIFVFADE